MRKVITYGTFDLLHRGHIALLERARSLGDYLIVGVTSDQFDRARGKLNVVQSTLERVDAVRATGIADKVIIEEFEGQKIEDVQRYNVDVFTVGSDWAGHFDYLKEWCEVIYLERTRGVSSTQLRREGVDPVRLSIISDPGMASRFEAEAAAVNGIDVISKHTYDDVAGHAGCLKGYLDDVDAVIICGQYAKKSEMIMEAIEYGKHVLYVPPAFSTLREAQKALEKASGKRLILQEGIKTLHFPAFKHLLLLVESGEIGRVRDVDLSCSQNPRGFNPEEADWQDGAMFDWAGLAMMPAACMLGAEPTDVSFNSVVNEGGCPVFTRCQLEYPGATAAITVGKGVKTENDMVITGSKGYVYVPSPWWLTDYFEIRHEDLTKTRKYFWGYEGEGLRYEILEFVRRIRNDDGVSRICGEHIWSSTMMERFLKAASNQADGKVR